MITRIHHINFIVENLDLAVAKYQESLGLGDFIFDSLEARAVKTARVKLGETWLVLVQPIDKTSVPALYLKEHGEGFFLMSLGTDDLEAQLKHFEEKHAKTPSIARRRGLEGWAIADLPFDDFFGAQLQLTEN